MTHIQLWRYYVYGDCVREYVCSCVTTVNCRHDGDVTQLSSVLILPNLYSQWQIRHKIDSTHAMQFMLTLICSSNVEFHCTNWKAILYWVMVVHSPSIHFQAATGGTCYITKNIFSNWTWKTIRKQLLMQHQRLLHGNHHVQLKVLQEWNTGFPNVPVLSQISFSFSFNSSYLWLLSGDSYTSSRLIPNSRFCFHRFHSLFGKCSQGRLGNQIRVSNHWGWLKEH